MASSLDDLFRESNFHSISSLTTIYGATVITGIGYSDKLLIAMLKGKILSYSLRKTGPSLAKPDSEVSFTYIPADASVVSIDCFTCEARGLIIAVAFYKDTNGKQTNYLNIYCNYSYDPSSKNGSSELETVAENCRSFELEFVPFQITHCKTRGRKENKDLLQTVFILLGGDCRVHVYSQDENQGEFSEQNLDNYFPEFQNLQSVPTFIDIKIAGDEKKRVSAVGHAAGDVSLFVTDLSSDEWKTVSYDIQHDSPITAVRLFTKHTHVEMPGFLRRKFSPQIGIKPLHEDYHLLVTSAREAAVVYCFCEERGFELPVLLDKSADHDCVTCCAIADIDRDGVNDIIIGTYGQELLVYKFTEPTLEIEESFDGVDPYTILPSLTKSFSYPVINMKLLDINGDGLDDIVVMTSKGLHILQCDVNTALKECVKKLERLKSLLK